MSDMSLPLPRHGRIDTIWALIQENPVLPVIAGIGFAVSFQTIAALARAQHMPGWPMLYPVLIDVFLLGVVVEARKAIDDGRSDLVPRAITWLLAGFTIYVNAHGSPARDWLGISLHVAAPTAWITFLELSRWRKLRRSSSRRDRIPLARWFLSPVTAARMYRRMVLHNVTSYPVACAREEAWMLAVDLARAVYGKRWRRDAPTVLRHQLRTGMLPDDVARMCEMTMPGMTPALAGPVEEWITKAQRQRVTVAARARREARAIEQADSAPLSASDGAPSKPPAARQKPASDRASKRAKAEKLLRANPAMSRADVVRLSGVSERTADRIRAELPRQLHVAEG